ncbi:AEG_G0016850.mRNA.1.CDS.1 [Saccharomyces cerevisiae]|nr:AEG_G0016850.mRNA.1.CDS.1 [Saccharomyces cerevisiae]CAI6642560.1 AEG_G0016850.mRNA.1.CDS.1 [Saccharomyces cerevisiae]
MSSLTSSSQAGHEWWALRVLAPADSASLMVCKDMLNLSTQTVNEILGSIMTSVRVRRKNGKTGLVFDHVAHIAPRNHERVS